MSLFQRSDDNQKFLVTLNGYNNNLMKEKISSEDDEERLEMEVISSTTCKAFPPSLPPFPPLNFNPRAHSRRTMFLLMLAGERGRRACTVDVTQRGDDGNGDSAGDGDDVGGGVGDKCI